MAFSNYICGECIFTSKLGVVTEIKNWYIYIWLLKNNNVVFVLNGIFEDDTSSIINSSNRNKSIYCDTLPITKLKSDTLLQIKK